MDSHRKYYQIGEVSRIGGISERTLRHYDELGLIKPDHIGKNGYRYYSRQTMLRIPVVQYLKLMGFSLEEIDAVLKKSDISYVQELFTKHLDICDKQAQEITLRRTTINDWKAMIDEANMVANLRPEVVSVKYLTSDTLLSMPSTFTSFQEAVVSLDFASFVKSINNAITGPVIVRFSSLDEAEAASVTGKTCPILLLQKTIYPIAQGGWEFKGGMYLTTYALGTHEKFNQAIGRLRTFAAKQGYRLKDEVLERFLVDWWSQNDEKTFVTEILIPIETE